MADMRKVCTHACNVKAHANNVKGSAEAMLSHAATERSRTFVANSVQ